MKHLLALLLALCLLAAVFPPAAQAEPEPDADPTPGPASQAPGPTLEPTAEPTAEPAPEPQPQQAKLYVDNKNVYEKMEKSYSQGYVPTVEKDTATIVLPLLCDGQLQGGVLRAKAALGDVEGPFVTKNYEKTVELAENPVNHGKSQVQGYYVAFALQLKAQRYMGSYPVAVTVTGKDDAGEVEAEFTVYVTIADGKDPNATPVPEPAPAVPEEPVVLGPKVLVQSYRAVSLAEDAQPGIVNAGDPLRVTVSLVNTSDAESLENMAVTAVSPGEGFALTSPTDSVYIGSLAPGAAVEVSYEYTVKPETPAGQYELALNYDFAYHKGQTGSGSGMARVDIHQPLEMEFALMRMPAEAVISDVVQVNVQAINLSHAKAYNVRATLEADGLLPGGTAFIGDLEGGASAEKPLQVQVSGLTKSEFAYGQTSGTITYFYEDGEGNEFCQEGSFMVNIKSPFADEEKAARDEPGQWWLIMGALAAAVLGIGGCFGCQAVRRVREGRRL